MAAGAQTLKRTPLYDRHVAAGARLVPFAGWEMPVQYAGIREEHVAVRSRAGVFDVSHMGEVETTGPDARGVPPARAVQRRRQDRRGGAQYSVLCREDGGVLDDLFTYRLGDALPDGHQRRPTTRATSPGCARQARRLRRRASTTASTTTRCSPSRGRRRARSSLGLADGELPARFRTATLTVAGAPGVLVCGTGYTGEDGVELLIAPRARGRGLGRPAWPAARPRRASARATRCAWRSASTCTATT